LAADVITDRVSGAGNAIGHVRLSVSALSKPSALALIFCVRIRHDDRSSPGIESQGHWSRSKVNAEMCALR